jgi:hypothetical protein
MSNLFARDRGRCWGVAVIKFKILGLSKKRRPLLGMADNAKELSSSIISDYQGKDQTVKRVSDLE